MPVRNESGEPVDYDVHPSDPGPPPAPLVENPALFALTASATGAGLTALGCLTGFGDQACVLVGLGFLVVGLVFQGVVLDRARRFSSTIRALRSGGSGKTHLDNDDEHAVSFTPGNWVVTFWSKKDPTLVLGQSPPVSGASTKVLLRRCVDPAHFGAGTRLSAGDMEYHVDVA